MGKRLRPVKYMVNRYILRKPFLECNSDLGIRLLFKTEDCLGRHVYKYGIYEREITRLVLSIPFEDGDIFIDIGANIGWYSLIVDKLVDKEVKVFSFEPEPFNYELLLKNMDLNQARNIKPVRKAIGDREGEVNLYIYPDKNRGRHSALPIYNYGFIKVPLTTLDSFVRSEGINRVKLIKIDVEGFEYMVLKGAIRTLSFTDFVILEVTPEYMRRGGVNYAEFVKFLAKLGFDMYVIRADTLRKINPYDLLTMNRGVNLFLYRRDVSFEVSSLLSS